MVSYVASAALAFVATVAAGQHYYLWVSLCADFCAVSESWRGCCCCLPFVLVVDYLAPAYAAVDLFYDSSSVVGERQLP